jgi:hypothetical protein
MHGGQPTVYLHLIRITVPRICGPSANEHYEAVRWLSAERHENEVRLIRFRSTIKIRGINPYVRVSAKIARQLKRNWRRPLPVLVQINERPRNPWHVNLMPAGDGSFYLYLHESVRNASRSKVGDRVTVELSFDDTYRSGPAHPLPDSFRQALRENAAAKIAWDALIPSRKKEILRYFAMLKFPESKARNLKRVMQVLSGSKARFMGRSWKHGK